MDEPLHVQPLSYWLDQISKMDIESLNKVKRSISAEILDRQFKTLTTKELYKLLTVTRGKIAHMSIDDENVEI